jgi:Domain of unknown function (DUF4136)
MRPAIILRIPINDRLQPFAEDGTMAWRPRASAVLLLVGLISLGAADSPLWAAKTDINVEYDKKFSFAGLKTWTWHPEGKGKVLLALTADNDPKKVADRVDPVIIPALEREMGARGFTIAADNPDLYVHYYVLGTLQNSTQVQGQFLPSVPEWGLPPFLASTTATRTYPVGTLIVDVTAPAQQKLVWRGSAARKIQIDRPDAERRKVLEEAIRELLKKFPPKK